jgi:D-3-phosphoglycerate dehydrogenase
MAAETLRLYLEDGTVRHSVNFPNASLPAISPDNIRVTVVNKNKPGMLKLITEVFAKHSLNIVQQINHSQGEIAYNVLDIDPNGTDLDFKELQKELTMHEGVLSSRILFGLPGTGYSRNIDGQYHV